MDRQTFLDLLHRLECFYQLDRFLSRQDIPARVKARVFDRYQGKCYVTQKKLGPGEFDFDHIVALCNGGEHRESNLAPIWKVAHKAKTAEDVRIKAKDARVRKKHLGLAPRKSTLPGSKGSQWKAKIGGGWVRRNEE